MFKNRKNMKEMVRISKMLIEGELELEKFLEILDTNQDLLNTFNKYAKKYLYTFFKNIKMLREDIKLSNDMHIFVYQLIQGFLWTKKVEFEIKASEYVFFNKMMKQCPEWFQCRFDLLLKMYDNLEELVNEEKLKEQIINDCKYESYPPYWLQNPEWPVIDGVVCIFQKQSDFPDYLDYDKDQITYTFLNPKTNEIIEVVQYD